mmetsp:Transcript_165/g.281  ORF Transcript_165/g.281 Transcript_165/m.281 type:complete len:224 (-) Transcript_165:132-803(-)|eukprot:CAMPEP_0177769536 /NCGR_PEP_ID=MMETSP0491_2-20121128/10380_1 /TAXON_ID=63592 /ORGANISM="Tetraselmis chuii, Strain PLY429" /LENGTH=223 /DNA_ID=CAMNT_0019286563 /DNA_START=141 /DNA_END=812 /DNA_ORIENTATION=+
MQAVAMRGSADTSFAVGASGRIGAPARMAAPRAAPGPLRVMAKESLIGKRPVPIPSTVKVKLDGQLLSVKGPKGELSQLIPQEIEVALEEGALTFKKRADNLRSRQMHGLSRSLGNNMVVGVSDGFEKVQQLIGVGYRANVDGKVLVLNLGLSHPVRLDIPPAVQVVAEDKGVTLKVSSYDKCVLGDFCAKIRSYRPPEPYKGKGIRFLGEYVRKKEGKSGKK